MTYYRHLEETKVSSNSLYSPLNSTFVPITDSVGVSPLIGILLSDVLYSVG